MESESAAELLRKAQVVGILELVCQALELTASQYDLANTTVSIIIVGLHAHTRDTVDLAPMSTRGGDTSSRWTRGRAVQDALGAPRGVKPLGRRAGRRKASGSGGKCASRSAAKNAYAAMQSDA